MKDPGNYRGITLLSVIWKIGKVFSEVLNIRLVQHFDKGGIQS